MLKYNCYVIVLRHVAFKRCLGYEDFPFMDEIGGLIKR